MRINRKKTGGFIGDLRFMPITKHRIVDHRQRKSTLAYLPDKNQHRIDIFLLSLASVGLSPGTDNSLMRLLSILLLICLSSCTYERIVLRNFPNVTDYKLFPQRTIGHADKEFRFQRRAASIDLPDQNKWGFYRGGKRITRSKASIDKYLEKSNTTALIIIRHDTILYEQYFNGYKGDSKSMHFSINKAIMSVLTSIAVKEGAFEGFDQEIGDFIPMYAEDERGTVTIENLVNMNSGFDCNDYHDQMRFIRLYYSKKPQKFMNQRKLKRDPGDHFAYSSFTTMLLGICLEEATGKTLSEYMEEKLWKKMGTT